MYISFTSFVQSTGSNSHHRKQENMIFKKTSCKNVKNCTTPSLTNQPLSHQTFFKYLSIDRRIRDNSRKDDLAGQFDWQFVWRKTCNHKNTCFLAHVEFWSCIQSTTWLSLNLFLQHTFFSTTDFLSCPGVCVSSYKTTKHKDTFSISTPHVAQESSMPGTTKVIFFHMSNGSKTLWHASFICGDFTTFDLRLGITSYGQAFIISWRIFPLYHIIYLSNH